MGEILLGILTYARSIPVESNSRDLAKCTRFALSPLTQGDAILALVDPIRFVASYDRLPYVGFANRKDHIEYLLGLVPGIKTFLQLRICVCEFIKVSFH